MGVNTKFTSCNIVNFVFTSTQSIHNLHCDRGIYRKAGKQLERAARAREKTVMISRDSDALDAGTVVLLRNLMTGRNKIRAGIASYNTWF